MLKNPDGSNYTADAKSANIVESKPHFYEWATATTGMLAVARKQRSTFRNYVAAETAAPVIACAAGKGPLDELDFQFAGVVRSNSVRTMCVADAQRIYQQSPPTMRRIASCSLNSHCSIRVIQGRRSRADDRRVLHVRIRKTNEPFRILSSPIIILTRRAVLFVCTVSLSAVQVCINRFGALRKSFHRPWLPLLNQKVLVFACFVFAATILNNSKDVIHAGDTIAWTFFSEDGTTAGTTSKARAAHGSVRRIGIRVADFHDECKIGRVRYAPLTPS